MAEQTQTTNPNQASNSNNWPHAPTHRLAESGTYFVTCGTYQKQNFFSDNVRLDVLQRGLLSVAREFGWQLEAWAMFSNHYHFIAHSPVDESGGESLRKMLSKLHTKTATWINKLDATPGRTVWHNYRESLLTHSISYMARLNYVHNNAVKHGIVSVATAYRWCSASWFESNASAAQIKTIYSVKCDKINVYDDFTPLNAEVIG